jgi:S-DNA-T family DNA segregation ATPase FtsK/SpoIIIE
MKFNWKLGPVAICCISSGIFPYMLGFGWKWLYFVLVGMAVPFLDLNPKYDRKSLPNILREVGLSKGKDKNEIPPKILWQKETETGMEAGIVLPVGVTSSDAQKRAEAVSEALNAKVKFEYQNGRTLLTVNRNKLDKFYQYKPVELGPVEIPLGHSLEGFKTLKFSDEVSSLLVAGMSGCGKSSFLRQLITNCILHFKPENIKCNLVDLKFGVEFGLFKRCSLIDTYIDDPAKVGDLIARLKFEAERRYKLFNEARVLKISKYNQIAEPLPFHLTIIDEMANLSSQDILDDLIFLGRLGRAAGIYFIFVTQYPTAEVVPSQLKYNCQARMAFMVKTAINSIVILDTAGAEELQYPGRAIFSITKNTEIQVPFLDEEETLRLIAPFEGKLAKKESPKPEPIRQYDKGVMSLDEWKKWKGL